MGQCSHLAREGVDGRVMRRLRGFDFVDEEWPRGEKREERREDRSMKNKQETIWP